MNHLFRLCCCLLAITFWSSAAAQDERAAATEAVLAYFGAFVAAVKAGDAAGVSQHLTEPCVLIDASSTTVFSTRAEYEAWLKPGLIALRAWGYDRAAWPQLDLKLLNKELAIASALIVRYKADGTEFDRVGATYFVRKVDGRWRIASFTTHDGAAVLKLS